LSYGNTSCIAYDCTQALPDGGDKAEDPVWQANCADTSGLPSGTSDGGADGGADAGP
jgi:hypothetical protein